MTTGTVALVGGGAFSPACEEIDRALLAMAGEGPVVVLPTAAAFEQPDQASASAETHWRSLGANVHVARVLGRADTSVAEHLEAVRSAALVYLADGSPMHLRSVLKDSLLWDALIERLNSGGVIVAAGAAATVVTDPMTDPRGGAFTLGLGMVAPLAVFPGHELWSVERSRRTREIAPEGICVASIDSATALVRTAAGWQKLGDGIVSIFLDGHEVGLDALPV